MVIVVVCVVLSDNNSEIVILLPCWSSHFAAAVATIGDVAFIAYVSAEAVLLLPVEILMYVTFHRHVAVLPVGLHTCVDFARLPRSTRRVPSLSSGASVVVVRRLHNGRG